MVGVEHDEGGAATLGRHAWIAVDRGRRLFDPTAHQFDGCGQAELGRYWIHERAGRVSFTEWRGRELGSSPATGI